MDSMDSTERDSSGRFRLDAVVRGHVQGVGFRYWTRTQIERLGLVGSAANLADGTVHVIAEGPRSGLDQLLNRLSSGAAPGRVDGVEADLSDGDNRPAGFQP
jgi:acylphosphatase